MCKILTAFLLIFSVTAYAQKDRRAPINLGLFTVTPGGKLLLIGKEAFYANAVNEDWHKGPVLKSSRASDYDNDYLRHVSFFNKDTGVIVGYISGKSDTNKNTGYYHTTDAGKTWQLRDLDAEVYIDDLHTDKYGNGWMGGYHGNIFYTHNGGLNWEKRNTPFNQTTRMSSIFMQDVNVGVAAGNNSALYTTKGNWNSSKKIASPHDQLKGLDSINDCGLKAVCLWKNYIIVTQCDKIFYTDTQEIKWKKFPAPIVLYKVDKENDVLLVVSKDLYISSYTSLTSSKLLYDSSLKEAPQRIYLFNSLVYVWGELGELFELKDGKFNGEPPYTPDIKINDPDHKGRSENLHWGVDGNELYFADDSGDWYRKKGYKIPFYVCRLSVLSDTTAIFYDFNLDTYLFNRNDFSLESYTPKMPLSGFLSNPLKAFSISTVSSGCFHFAKSMVEYKKFSDSVFKCVSYIEERNTGRTSDGHKKLWYKKKVSSAELDRILSDINEQPSKIPSINDFAITSKEKKAFPAFVEKIEKKRRWDSHEFENLNSNIYNNIPKTLDTVGAATLKGMFDEDEGIMSTSSMGMFVELINDNNDTLFLSHYYYNDSKAFHLPFLTKYKQNWFKCYDINLARYIYKCLPDKFMERYWFDNKYLMLNLGDVVQKRMEADK